MRKRLTCIETSTVVPDDQCSLRSIEEIQVAAWGMPDRYVVPSHVLEAVVNTGGQILVARTTNADKKIIGFAAALLARSDKSKRIGPKSGEYYLLSHMVAVSPEHQGGVGFLLKRAQRDDALKRGVQWIQWTYYPMLANNAALNFRKIGAQSCVFTRNKHGVETGGLYRDLPSDRLTVSWDLRTNPREWLTNSALPLVRVDQHAQPEVDEQLLKRAQSCTDSTQYTFSIPLDFVGLRNRDLKCARVWQTAFARVAETLLDPASGFSIVNFRRAPDGDLGEYLFARA